MDTNHSVVPPAQRGSLEGIVDISVTHWLVVVTTLLLLLVGLSIQSYRKPEDSRVNLPLAGDSDPDKASAHFAGEGSWDVYKEGYKKYKDIPYKMIDDKSKSQDNRQKERVSLPHSMLPELAKYPDGVLSARELHAEDSGVEYCMKDPSTPIFRRVLLSQLTPALPRVTETLREEVVAAMQTELPDSKEWTEMTVAAQIMRIVAKSCGRIFVGPECCREPSYLATSTTFIFATIKASGEIKKINKFLRPILAPRLASVKDCHKQMDNFIDVLQPAIEKRLQLAEELGADYDKPDDMTQWMIDSGQKIGKTQVIDIALEQSMVSFTAVNATTQHVNLAFFSLAAHPELVPILLEDIKQALKHSDGKYTHIALQNMKKLDSFLKEVGRYEPFQAYANLSKVMKNISLTNGMHIPKNSVVEINWNGIARDEEHYPDPDKFDALRFYNPRIDKEYNPSAKGMDGAAQFTNVSTTHLTWNYGRRACPGRFFASNVIKLIFAELLLNYEIKNPDGVEGKQPNMRGGGIQAANPASKLLIRRK